MCWIQKAGSSSQRQAPEFLPNEEAVRPKSPVSWGVNNNVLNYVQVFQGEQASLHLLFHASGQGSPHLWTYSQARPGPA